MIPPQAHLGPHMPHDHFDHFAHHEPRPIHARELVEMLARGEIDARSFKSVMKKIGHGLEGAFKLRSGVLKRRREVDVEVGVD